MLNDSYSFTRPLTTDGKPTRYLSILSMLNKLGPTSKCAILDHVWYHDDGRASRDPYNWRGDRSSLFASMRRKGIAEYSTKTRKWSITEKGKKVLENAKCEWGMRYAEDFWN